MSHLESTAFCLDFLEQRVLNLVCSKIVIFWDIAARGPYMNQRFGGMYRVHLQGLKPA
jgi:hypothetical protein